MDAETQQRLFEPFYTTKEVGKGTGLGLATAYAILQAHQGWIECESQLGTGTTFSIYLPVAPQEEIFSAKKPQEEGISRGTETILFVEDEEDVLDSVVPVIQDFGYEVLVERDGEEGWERFQRERERIDLIVLDLSMPKMSGAEMFERVRAIAPDVKIILSTGNIDSRAESLGAQALLKKPYRLTQALQTIRQVLDE